MYIFNFNTTLTQSYVPALIPCMVDTASLAGRPRLHALHAVLQLIVGWKYWAWLKVFSRLGASFLARYPSWWTAPGKAAA